MNLKARAFVLFSIASAVLTGGSMFGGCGESVTTPLNTISEEPPQFILEWGKRLDMPGTLHQPVGICVGSDEIIYVSDFNFISFSDRAAMQAYSRDGEFVAKWSPISSISYDVAASRHFVYTRSLFGRVEKFDRNGQSVEGFPFRSVSGIATDQTGNVYVAGTYIDTTQPDTSYVGPHVWKLSGDEEILEQWRHMERGLLTVGADGYLYIIDDYTVEGIHYATISKYDVSGIFIFKWPLVGLRYDFDFAVDSDGNIYIAEYSNEVSKYRGDGTLLSRWSEVSPDHEPLGRVTGVAIDAEDNLYLTDWHQGRVVKYSLK